MNITNLSKDILRKTFLQLPRSTLYNLCLSCKKFNKTINDYYFWVNRLKKYYGFSYSGKKDIESIKSYYRKIQKMSNLERMKEARTNLSLSMWYMKHVIDELIEGQKEIIKKLDMMNRF